MNHQIRFVGVHQGGTPGQHTHAGYTTHDVMLGGVHYELCLPLWQGRTDRTALSMHGHDLCCMCRATQCCCVDLFTLCSPLGCHSYRPVVSVIRRLPWVGLDVRVTACEQEAQHKNVDTGYQVLCMPCVTCLESWPLPMWCAEQEAQHMNVDTFVCNNTNSALTEPLPTVRPPLCMPYLQYVPH